MINLFLALFSLQLLASVYEINKDHSHINYKIPYMSFSESEGSFAEYSGKIDFDLAKNELNSLSAKISVESINTQDKKRDAHLRGSDFFDVKKFPHILFTSDSVSKIDKKNFDVWGRIEIKGITQNILLKTELKGHRKDHTGKESLFFKAITKLNRKNFGLHWNKSLGQGEYLVGDEVAIEIIIQAQPIGRRTGFSTHMIPSNENLERYAKFKRGEGQKPPLPDGDVSTTSSSVPIKEELTTNQKDNSDVFFPWWKITIGFLGFCLLIVISYFVKIKMISFFKLTHYTESGIHSLLADAIIIGLTFIYALWFYKILYP